MESYPRTLKTQAETALIDPNFDFIAKYHAVADLRRLARKHPTVLDDRTIDAVERLLQSNAFGRVRQAYFFFREAAMVMTDMATATSANGLKAKALTSLNGLLCKTNGSAHRGIAEALGSLPVCIGGPRPMTGGCSVPPTIAWERLVSDSRLVLTGTPRTIGRSLVVEIAGTTYLLVVKLAKPTDTAAGLEKEIRWMERLAEPNYAVDCRFHIPTPLYVNGRRVFRLQRLPMLPPKTVERHPDGLAIAFVAHRNYYVYPNSQRVDGLSAREMLARNAFLLGWLTANGMIHDAPIPLFHNRTQRMRRDDQGRYQWFRSGRLDQWLDSCAFPNFGLSGLRDFEHLETCCAGGQHLYRHIGSHLLSLLLVAGSHFRSRDTSRVGLDAHGEPVDTRDLFDSGLLKSMIVDIFSGYFSGFSETPPAAPPPVNLDRLTARMIEEMGVDRHMTELLRRVDQNHMTDGAFLEFLRQRGYAEDRLDRMKRGEKDILISSGPHLGDFNRQICLPELIEAVAAMSAVCIAGRFAAHDCE